MRKILLFLVFAMFLVSGCAEEEQDEEPTVIIIEEKSEEIVEPEEEPEEIVEPKEEAFEGRTIEMTATNDYFIPDEISIAYKEKVRIIITSNYSGNNFYAPSMGVYEEIGIGKTVVYIPTDRVGVFQFWNNVTSRDSRYKTMRGRMRIE